VLFDYFNNISFAHPELLWLLLGIPVLMFWYFTTIQSRSASIPVSTTSASGLGSWKASMRHLPFIFRVLSMAAIIVAIARPQTRDQEQKVEGEGIDIVLCLDVSGSMTAQDLTPNRLEAAKTVP